MVIADSITRLIKGVLEKEEATQQESYENGLLEHPHYTRPAEFEGQTVPAVLISGDHKKIAEWKKQESIQKTQKKRPDLFN
jgi:tRNA (guanine37-N1)-methyltransferase